MANPRIPSLVISKQLSTDLSKREVEIYFSRNGKNYVVKKFVEVEISEGVWKKQGDGKKEKYAIRSSNWLSRKLEEKWLQYLSLIRALTVLNLLHSYLLPDIKKLIALTLIDISCYTRIVKSITYTSI